MEALGGILILAIAGVLVVLAPSIGIAWLITMLIRKKFGLRELFLFVTAVAVWLGMTVGFGRWLLL